MWFESNWFVGILSGLISSFCFFIILFLIKPKIIVSKNICESVDKNGDKFYRIKIVNKTRSMLVNVSYSLFYKTDNGDGTYNVVEIPPYKSPVNYVSRYYKSEKKSKDYAIRISYLIDSKKYPIYDNSKLVFSIMAKHQTTGSTKAISNEYTKSNIKKGLFETGVSTKIINSG